MIPDNGRGTANTGQLDLPLNVLGGIPLCGRLATGDGAIGIGPTPRGPLVGSRKAWAQIEEPCDNEQQNSHNEVAKG